MAKTVSSRIPNDLHDQLRERCNNARCNTNDIIRGLLELELRGDTEIDFGNEEENIPGSDTNPTPTPKTFTCENGNLYENGSMFGRCANYNFIAGDVYDKNSTYLGKIKQDDPKPTSQIIYVDD